MPNVFYERAKQKLLNPIPTLRVTAATQASPIAITTNIAHGLSTGAAVSIRDVGGNTNANGVQTITVTSETSFTLDGTTGNAAYTSGGEVLLNDAQLRTSPHIIRWGLGTSGDATYGDDIRAVLVNVSGAGTTYTVDAAVHEFLSDIPAGARISTTNVLASKTNSIAGPPFIGGVADAADTVFPTVTDGTTVEAYVIYKDTGTAATSPLIAYFDTATGLPFTGNGANVDMTWDSDNDRIFRL